MIDRTSPPTDSEYLENLSQKIFISGFAWPPVRDRWPRFQEAFCRFDPEIVADMPEELIEHLCGDPGLIRNRRKIRAVVANAARIVEIAGDYGSFWRYLRSLDHLVYKSSSRLLSRQFASCGPNTIYYFLMAAGESVPAKLPQGVRTKKA